MSLESAKIANSRETRWISKRPFYMLFIDGEQFNVEDEGMQGCKN